jgi:protein dithiol oxidoreductase (disulfide-forming)
MLRIGVVYASAVRSAAAHRLDVSLALNASPAAHSWITSMLRLVSWLMFLVLPLSACAQSASSSQVDTAQVGIAYELAPKPGTWLPENGKIEVVEYFSYTCSHCAEFQPMVDTWKKSMAKDVIFHYMPNAFDIEFPYSRAYFAAEATGALPKVHHDLFLAIQHDGRLPRNNATIDEIGAYFAQRGLNRAKMVTLMRSDAVTAQMQRANQFVIDKRLQGTPTLVVAGKYVVKGENYKDYIDNLNAVVAMERAQRRAAVKPAKKP